MLQYSKLVYLTVTVDYSKSLKCPKMLEQRKMVDCPKTSEYPMYCIMRLYWIIPRHWGDMMLDLPKNLVYCNMPNYLTCGIAPNC